MKKIFFSVFLLLISLSCRNDEKEDREILYFSQEEITARQFDNCEKKDCPEIVVKILKARGRAGVAERINNELSRHHASLIAVSEDMPSKTLEKALVGFISDYKEFIEEYAMHSEQYKVEISDKILFRSDSLIVIETEYYVFTGGAHGYGATNFISFNSKTGEQLGPNDLFSDITAFKKFVEQKFRRKFEIPVGQNINSTGFFFPENVFRLPENIAILEDEVILVYNPYEIASYSMGEIVLRFPKSRVRKWLRYN